MQRPFALLLVLSLILLGACDDDSTGPSDCTCAKGGLELDDYQPAEVVVGQTNGLSGSPNGGGQPNAWVLNGPTGLTLEGESMFIADRLNRRVQAFTDLVVLDGLPATYAVGQPGLNSSDPGLNSMRFQPFDSHIADGRLFVADDVANRVLIWNSVPEGDTPADVVLGQVDFTSGTSGVSDSTMSMPVRVRAAGGKLFVLDNGNARCLIWNSIPTANGTPADVVVGAPDFDTITGDPTDDEFGFGLGLWTDGTRLAIGDGTNNRVMVWNSIPTTNGAPADFVVGAADFTTVNTSPELGPANPAALESDGESLFVADSENHRVLIYTPFPTGSGALPTGVLGQRNFTDISPNDDPDTGGISRRVLNSPSGLLVLGTRLLVADTDNHRVLAFESN